MPPSDMHISKADVQQAKYEIFSYAGPQWEFYGKALQKLLTLAKAVKYHVFFMDSARFVLSAFVGVLWCFERVFINAVSGRHCVNVIDLIHDTRPAAIYHTTYINVYIFLLKNIPHYYAGSPIHILTQASIVPQNGIFSPVAPIRIIPTNSTGPLDTQPMNKPFQQCLWQNFGAATDMLSNAISHCPEIRWE